ncbi:MAG: hypothetical protein AAGM67_05155 [Bacteroidota bacterium]
MEKLDLGQVKLTQEGVDEIIKSPHLSNLKKLSLENNSIQEGVSLLPTPNLEVLWLAGMSIPTEEILKMGLVPTFNNLKELTLSHQCYGDQDQKEIQTMLPNTDVTFHR